MTTAFVAIVIFVVLLLVVREVRARSVRAGDGFPDGSGGDSDAAPTSHRGGHHGSHDAGGHHGGFAGHHGGFDGHTSFGGHDVGGHGGFGGHDGGGGGF